LCTPCLSALHLSIPASLFYGVFLRLPPVSSFSLQWFLRYTNIQVERPSVNEDMAEVPITPHDCRLRDLTYAAPCYVDLRYVRGVC
jgi:DNA-directed RNA polymerase beta subunit